MNNRNIEINKKDYHEVVQTRLLQDALLRVMNLQLVSFHPGATAVVEMKWVPGTLPSAPWKLDADNIALVLGRECARAAAMLGLGHEDLFVEHFDVNPVRPVPEQTTLHCRALAQSVCIDPHADRLAYRADVSGTVYLHTQGQAPVTLANLVARVVKA